MLGTAELVEEITAGSDKIVKVFVKEEKYSIEFLI